MPKRIFERKWEVLCDSPRSFRPIIYRTGFNPDVTISGWKDENNGNSRSDRMDSSDRNNPDLVDLKEIGVVVANTHADACDAPTNINVDQSAIVRKLF